jgi:hypothetical protein
LPDTSGKRSSVLFGLFLREASPYLIYILGRERNYVELMYEADRGYSDRHLE